MLPNKNELNDELIERISGGESDNCFTDFLDSSSDDYSPIKKISGNFFCPTCGGTYDGTEPRTDGFCPNCEPRPLETSIPTGDMKTTVPGVSDKDGMLKIH